MRVFKQLLKKFLGLDPFTGLSPMNNLVHVGSVKHGYHIPDHFLTDQSVCYCVGAGEDISFDIELVTRYGSRVVTIDPMPYAKEHFEKVKDALRIGTGFTIDKGRFAYTYAGDAKVFNNITFHETGIWNEKKIVKFFDPAKENYAGHSIINLQETDTFIEAPVDRLSNIMKHFNHSAIDLLKLEIEGSEYTVIDTLVEDRPDIKVICVEFDELYHARNPGYLWRIKRSTNQILKLGYRMAHTTPQFKRTFVREDVFNKLQAQKKNTAKGSHVYYRAKMPACFII